MSALRCLAVLGLVLGLALPLAAQADSEEVVTVQLDPALVKLGGNSNLIVTIHDRDSGRIAGLPRVDGLQLGPVMGPNRSVYSTFNSRTRRRQFSQTLTYRIPIKPDRAGEFTVPPLRVQLPGPQVTEVQTEPVVLTVVEDLRGEELGYFEIVPSSTRVVEGQPFTLELRFGWDAALADRINYVNLSLPWWGKLPGTIVKSLPPSSLSAPMVGPIRINGEGGHEAEEVGREEIRGRSFRILVMRRQLVPGRTGTLELSSNFLEFARAVEQGAFLSRGLQRVESYYVVQPTVEIEVVPLPEEGRPYDFTGAVGSLRARGEADRRDVRAGDSIKFSVEWTGEGNLRYFAPPDPSALEAFEGFRVYGTTDEKEPEFRRVTYDIAPSGAEVTEIPPLPLPVFDPERMEYTTVETRPIPIRVRALEGAVELEGEGEGGERLAEDIRDLDTAPLAGELGGSWSGDRGYPGLRWFAAALAGIPLLWLSLRTYVRRRGEPLAVTRRRRRAARQRLERALAGAADPAAELSAVQAFLAVETGEAEAAWVGRDVLAWYRGVGGDGGDPPGEVRELAELLGQLERAVFGGTEDGAGAAGGVDRTSLMRVATAAAEPLRRRAGA